MRSFALENSLLLLLIGCLASGLASAAPADPLYQAPDAVLVKFRPGTPADAQREAHQLANGRVQEVISGLGVTVVEVGVGSVDGAIAVYERNPNVEYAEPNYHRLLFRPVTTEGSEPSLSVANNFTEQWALSNTGQGFGASVDPIFGTLIHPTYQGTPGADISANAGWGTDRHGSPAVAIAVLDSGVECTHSDLAGKCIEQINFVAEHGSSGEDLIGHGTHVAGIAAAATDNGIGIAGVGWDTSIGSMKVCWEDMSLAILGIIIGQCDDADIAEAISYVASSGMYQVINMSLAGPETSITLQNAIQQAWDAGIVIVAGAGNEYTNTIMYPAGYSQVIGVGSTDQHDNLSYFSSFGNWVSVLAPGSTILSTVPGGFCGQSGVPSDCYDWKSGTSMSSPHVAGLAALLWAQMPGATNAGIRSIIQGTADPAGALGQNFTAWAQYGRINMGAALAAGSGPGLEPTSHHVASLTGTMINLGRGTKQAQVRIRVVDDLGSAVDGALVAGTFSGSFVGPASGATDGTGFVTLTSAGTAKGGVATTFCVDDVAAGTTYDPGMNSATCVSF